MTTTPVESDPVVAPAPNRLVPRRAALGAMGGVGAALVAVPLSRSVEAVTCSTVTPTETAGPYPGDGSNGPNVLTMDGVVRSDIRSSFGVYSGGAPGVTTTLDITVLDAVTCAPLAGAAVYVWHADAQGRYSLYSSGATGANFLRGVQIADADGHVSFTTVFPGAYDGRWPHIHFEVYDDVEDIVSASNKLLVSQFAIPEVVAPDVYATASGVYPDSASNLGRVSLSTDNVFRDGWASQLVAASGSAATGYALSAISTVSGGTVGDIAGTIASADSIDEILAASDYVAADAQVLRLYRAFFARYPDLSGAKFWLAAFHDGTTIERIAACFADSTEFREIYGTDVDDGTFVSIVYTNVLERTPESGGYTFWTTQLASGAWSREAMVQYVANSPEATAAWPFAPT